MASFTNVVRVIFVLTEASFVICKSNCQETKLIGDIENKHGESKILEDCGGKSALIFDELDEERAGDKFPQIIDELGYGRTNPVDAFVGGRDFESLEDSKFRAGFRKGEAFKMPFWQQIKQDVDLSLRENERDSKNNKAFPFNFIKDLKNQNIDGRTKVGENEKMSIFEHPSEEKNINQIDSPSIKADPIDRRIEAEHIYSTLKNPKDLDGIELSRGRRDVDHEITTTTNPNDNLTTPSIDYYKDPSCRNKCGHWRPTPCSCDFTCFPLRTCCEDVSWECPSLRMEARDALGGDLVDAEGISICDADARTFLIDKCAWPKRPKDPISDGDFLSVIQSKAIVYDNDTGLVFRNTSVYNCYRNNSDSLVQWAASFLFSDDWALKKNAMNPQLTLSVLKPETARFLPQSIAVSGHQCRPIIETCAKELSHLDTDNMCGKYISHYREVGNGARFINRFPVYGNRHCFQCNLNRTDGEHGILLEDSSKVRTPALSVLMDYTKTDDGLQISLTTKIGTSSNEWSCSLSDPSIPMTLGSRFTNTAPQCKAVQCRLSQDLIEGSCVRHCGIRSVFRHPSDQPIKMYQLLHLARFTSCYISSRELLAKHINSGIQVYGSSVAKFFSDFDPVPRIFRDYFDDVKEEDYFVIQTEFLSKQDGRAQMAVRKSYVDRAEDAMRYWYMENGYAEDKEEDDVLYLKNVGGTSSNKGENVSTDEREESLEEESGLRESNDNNNNKNDDNNNDNDNDDSNMVKVSQRNAVVLGVTGTALVDGRYVISTGPVPLGKKMSAEVSYEGLASCFGGGHSPETEVVVLVNGVGRVSYSGVLLAVGLMAMFCMGQ